MNIRKTLQRASLGLLGAGILAAGSQSAFAIDLFKKGCCKNGGSAWVSRHSTPHAVPARVVPYAVPVGVGYQYVPVAPPIAVRRQLPGSPPDPVPKWARPPGTVPVLAIQAPDPRWVHPSALQGYNAAPAPVAPNYSRGVAPAPAPFASPVMNAPLQPVPAMNNGPLQPVPASSAPGYPTTARMQPPITLTQGTDSDVDSLLNNSQPDPSAPAAAAPGNAAPNTPVSPGGVPLQPAPLSPVPAQPLPPGYGAGQPMPLQQYTPPVQQYAPPNAGPTPYVMSPSPYGAPMARGGNPAHNSKVYGFDDSGKRPPGTLGKTYLRPTRMIDWDKHPRTGQLDVEVLDTLRHGLAPEVRIKVTARDIYNHFKPLEGYLGEDDVWHFESEPLLPTVPHIYDVKFELVRERVEQERRYGRLFERIIEDKLGTLGVRRIRLIPGRIVDLVMY